MKNWNFPSVQGGNINSINNAGLETFRDNPIESLTREICQNSLDAIRNHNEPVMVEFKEFSTEDFPNKEELIQIFHKCKRTWEGKNAKSEDFIQEALRILNQDSVSFLRISDFNTKGLVGAQKAELGSPWSSLIKEAGSSNKSDDSGGSFGIGKSAPFLISKLRTLFYSSYAEDGYKSHIGVSNIMSFEKNDGSITSGVGYYTNTYDSRAIEGLIDLNSDSKRITTGTDIFVSGFEWEGNWKEEIIRSVLLNFFITVYQKKLIVKINDIEINHHNVGEFINGLDDTEENKVLKNYYYLLDSDDKIVAEYPEKIYTDKRNYETITFEHGEAKLYLTSGDNLNRKVLMTRKNGMRIYEQGRISGSISFSGILMITGNRMNSIFKQLENPAHNGWSANRYEKNPKLAEKIYKDLRSFIREQVKEQFQNNNTDEMDAVGLSDFLPNKNLLKDKGEKSNESINSTIKEVKFKKKKSHSSTKSSETEETDKQLLGKYGITEGEGGGSSHKQTSSSGGNGGGTDQPGGDNELDREQDGDLDNEKEPSHKTLPVASNQKYICTNKSRGDYNYLIKPKSPITEGQLVFKVIGEQSNYDLPILQANFFDQDVEIKSIHKNKISFKATNQPINEMRLSIQIDYPEYCTMEVSVYENK
uniref:hypothetical protein n=1 Tax=uncultured Allobacillus sp. TaxID=1638025 RepID=UPI0025979CB1|nr:hypothetical protein [uncultured Allobacillus sp.]